jgi:uncharacterized membrane protein YGL010W
MGTAGSLPRSHEPIIGLMSTVHTLQTCSLRSILISFFYLRLGIPGGLFRSGFSVKIFLYHLMRAACPVHPIFLDLILKVCGEECKLGAVFIDGRRKGGIVKV